VSIAAFVNCDLLCSLFSPVTLSGRWIFHSTSGAVVLISTCALLPAVCQIASAHPFRMVRRMFLALTPRSVTCSVQIGIPISGAVARSVTVTSSFNTCFNLHFTSPPSFFKLFPFLFGLALHVIFKTDPIGCITYLLISLVRRLG